ncbi:MAG: GntR family transcriptional regulator [Halioglobus sp.]|nr:GntR family transcriptional regulator [Halioglobus sp.]
MELIGELFSEQQRQGIKQEAPTPLYFQLYSILKSAILDGTLVNGARMPTEQQLAEAFGVSRITAKRAMDELAAEHMVERRRGKGTHVTYEYKLQPVQAPLVGMLAELESMARHSKVTVLECEQRRAPAFVRAEFGIGEEDVIQRMVRVRERDGLPFGYYSSWTMGLERPITKAQAKKKSRLELFRERGLHLSHVTQTISAVAAPPELAEALQADEGQPLISLVRRSYSKSGGQEVLRDFMHIFYHPDRFQYQMDLKLDGEGSAVGGV